MSKEKWSLGIESTADENSVKTVEITANNLEFYMLQNILVKNVLVPIK